MKETLTKKDLGKFRAKRVRSRIRGTAAKPRLSINKSVRHFTAQIIDDAAGRTLASIKSFPEYKNVTVPIAEKLGLALGEKAKAAGIKQVVFDRGYSNYAGQVKAFAEGARKGGLEF